MKFKTRKQQRHVIETMDAILAPLQHYLNDDAVECITIGMRILRDVEVETDHESQ